ncbi:MAG: spore coat protein [Alphaproteobacteria bacterium]|nr:spore coat protein [Alphaproteobacteria bacterium]
MGSSRLPGKALIDLAGRPLLWHMMDRLRRVPGLDALVLATTADPRNDPICDLARSEGYLVVREEKEDDLAARFAKVVRLTGADVVVKTGADCPFIDPEVLTGMKDRFVTEGDADFVSNRLNWSFPLGLSADVVSARAILWCDANMTDPEDRELFAIRIRDNPERWKVIAYINQVNLSHHHWLVDHPEDLVLVRRIADALYRPGECFGMRDIIGFLEASKDAA